MSKTPTVTGDNKHHWFQRHTQREQLERLQLELAKANEEIEQLHTLLSEEQSAMITMRTESYGEIERLTTSLDFAQLRIDELEEEKILFIQSIETVVAERDKAQTQLREVGEQGKSLVEELHEMTCERDALQGRLNAIESREKNIAAFEAAGLLDKPKRGKKSTKVVTAESEQAL